MKKSKASKLVAKATIRVREDKSYCVETTWSGVPLDRTEGVGYGVGFDRSLAERLVAAINAGVVFTEPVVKTDVYGHTYVVSKLNVIGRYMNADLKRLGF